MPCKMQSSYRPEIDGLRAFAVVAVIINHFNKDILPCGYLGVDIFFVISGYVITSSLSERESKDFGEFLSGFYERRIKRLVPALVVYVAVTSILICMFNPEPRLALKTGITSLFGLSNLYLFKQSTNYFAQSTELNSFIHTWSLGVEEQFYFLFPVLVWFTGFGRQALNGPRNLFFWISVLSIVSLISFDYLYQVKQPAAHFLMPPRFWEMAVGCLIFIGCLKREGLETALEKVPPLLVVFAMVGVMFLSNTAAVPATIGIVFLSAVLIACLKNGTAAYQFFTHKDVVFVGLASYSLYLWHWGVISISRWTIGIYWWTIPFQITLIVLLSILSYHYVETPFRRAKWAFVRWKTIGYGISASTIASLPLLALVKIPRISLYAGNPPSLIAAGVSSLTNTYSIKGTSTLWRGEKCVLSDNSQVGKRIALEDCTLGSFSNAAKRVLVVGNSYSAAFTHAFDKLVVTDGYSVTITSSWGASPVGGMPNSGSWDKANTYYWDTIVPALVHRLKPRDWVFLINDMAEFSPKHSTFETKVSTKQLRESLERLSRKLSAKEVRLAILHGIPFAREANCQPVVAAKQWFSPFGGPCKLPNRSESLMRRDNLDKVLISLQERGVLSIVDLFDVFCPDEQCTYNARNGQLLYRDESSHPSVEAVRLSAKTIRSILVSR